MKKILSLILALMLLALCPVMAETAVAPQTLTSPKGDYTFEVPEDYFTLNGEFMKGLLNTPEMLELVSQMLGMEDSSQLEMYFDQLEASNMMVVYTPDWRGNFNVQATEASLTMEMVVTLKTMMDAAMIAQFTSMGVAEEDIQLMDIQEIAGRQWYGVQVKMAGMDVLTMMTVENGSQYTLTFTGLEADMMQSILESFTVVPVAQ